MLRRVFAIASALSMLLCVAVCVLWVRGLSGADEAEWRYDRWLPDRSAATDQVYLTSDKRLWLIVNWGRADPPNGRLARGYYSNANESGGRPSLRFRHCRYEPRPTSSFFMPAGDNGTTGWGPLRWQNFTRSVPGSGERFRMIRIGVSHWLGALLLLALPTLWLNRLREAHHARSAGLCPACGYDLRASLERCPECGTPIIAASKGRQRR